MMIDFFESLSSYKRIKTKEVQIGNRPIGGENPIRLQSMTSIDTNDIEAVTEQTKRIIDAGGDYVRITAQGIREAESLKLIKEKLIASGYDNPIVADIHFNPKAAEVSALYVEKVRINPGNYVDKRISTDVHYTDEEYNAELEKTRHNLKSLFDICKRESVAIRIGVNHGSLSQRVMSRYGDTAEGLVMSLIEFLQICIAEDFHSIVLSIKASNTRVMVQACRMLVVKMKEMGQCYPIHLGVTEAGEGEDGRLKSAVGIGTLLIDGIGDTVRVSLTEDPECEIPVAREIVDYCTQHSDSLLNIPNSLPYNPYSYSRRNTLRVQDIGGNKLPIVMAVVENNQQYTFAQKPDFILLENGSDQSQFDYYASITPHIVVPYSKWKDSKKGIPLHSALSFTQNEHHSSINIVQIHISELDIIDTFEQSKTVVLLLEAGTGVAYRKIRSAIIYLQKKGFANPIIVSMETDTANKDRFQIQSAAGLGGIFIDGLADGICLQNKNFEPTIITSTAFGILQASRVRFSKTEFISCPSCGRTLFDIQKAVKEIRERTGHLANLKIGIMGCIVNGPGEMADADYGYVGAGRGLITLYKEKEVVRKNIPAESAVDELIELIKENGDWKDKV